MKLTIEKYVHIDANSTPGNPSFSFFDCSMEEYEYVLIGKQEITIDLPDDFNPIPMQIQAFKNEQKKIRAEAEARALALEEKIQMLLCIEAPKECAGRG